MQRPGAEAAASEGDAIHDWFDERRTSLLAALSGADPAASVWTFAGTSDAAWWSRRMASETAVHRWDVEVALSALEQVHPIDSDLATDAVAEDLEVSLLFSSSRPDRAYPAESLHLHRGDGPGRVDARSRRCRRGQCHPRTWQG